MNDFWNEKGEKLKRSDLILPAKYRAVSNSWLHENKKINYLISLIPFFFIQEWIHDLLATVENKKTGAYEWVYYNYYKQQQLLYQAIWFCIWFALCGLMVWTFNLSTLTDIGIYTGLQVFFDNQHDSCAISPGDNALMVYLSPEQLIDRKSFPAIRGISENEKNLGFVHDVYYQPMDVSMTITFQMLMSHMERWIHKMSFEDRCVCFYHFGVGLRGGFVQGQFFVDPEVSKVGSNTVITKIGGISYNVPAISLIKTLEPSSCKPVEVRVDNAANACIQHCSR